MAIDKMDGDGVDDGDDVPMAMVMATMVVVMMPPPGGSPLSVPVQTAIARVSPVVL